jgi:hypothetical protein
LHTLRRQNLRPGLLGVVEHERDELHQRLLSLVARRVRLPAHLCGRVGAAAHSRQRQEIALKYQAQHQQNDETADPNVESAKIKPPPPPLSSLRSSMSWLLRRASSA